MSEPHFEMLWDCPQCESKGLLGKTHRHCPTCGAAQDPSKRYFPEPGQEVEVKDHRFVGKDWLCGYCESPSSAAAAFCGNCGAPKEGAKDVALVSDRAAAPPTPPTPPPTKLAGDGSAPAKGSRWVMGLVLLVLFGLAAGLYQLFSKHDEAVQLVDKAWTRQIDVERYTAVRSSDWCDSLPAGAYSVNSTREQRSTRQIEDGQTCREVRTDAGDGTFSKRQECSPRYRSEPVYDNKCSYRINRWQVLRTDTLQGGAALAPAWPTPLLANNLAGGGTVNTLGAERLGTRTERYTVNLKSAKGKTWTCPVDAAMWATLEDGQNLSMKVRGTGGAVCDSLVYPR